MKKRNFSLITIDKDTTWTNYAEESKNIENVEEEMEKNNKIKQEKIQILSEINQTKTNFLDSEQTRLNSTMKTLTTNVYKETNGFVKVLKSEMNELSEENKERLTDHFNLENTIKKLESDIEMFEKYFKIKCERTKENTLRLYFLGLYDEEQQEGGYAKIDIYFNNNQDILLLNPQPQISNVKLLENELNSVKRLDLIIYKLREEFVLITIPLV